MDLQIPGYRIERELGQGGMATVYLAIEEKFERHVALKVMDRKLAADPKFTERFIREGRYVAKLDHPNIVNVFDAGVADGHYYLAMQYLSGGTLENRLKQGLSVSDGLSIIKAVAGALGYAHEQDIFHRDVKPQNILFYPNGTPVLSDFGVAKAAESSLMLTATGAALGSPLYMSPEQIENKPVDARTDLYALGIILYEILTGQMPYRAEQPLAVLFKHL